MNILITFMWTPAHRGINGDEILDALAKQTRKHEEIVDISLSKSEAKGIIKRNIIKECQHSWETANTGRHFYAVQSEVGKVRSAKHLNKTESKTYQT